MNLRLWYEDPETADGFAAWCCELCGTSGGLFTMVEQVAEAALIHNLFAHAGVLLPLPDSERFCSMPGCRKKRKTAQHCSMHDHRKRTGRDMNAPIGAAA